jgi:hypothetical protein
MELQTVDLVYRLIILKENTVICHHHSSEILVSICTSYWWVCTRLYVCICFLFLHKRFPVWVRAEILFTSHTAARFVFRREPTGRMPSAPDSCSVVLALNVRVRCTSRDFHWTAEFEKGTCPVAAKWNSGNCSFISILFCVSLGLLWQW